MNTDLIGQNFLCQKHEPLRKRKYIERPLIFSQNLPNLAKKRTNPVNTQKNMELASLTLRGKIVQTRLLVSERKLFYLNYCLFWLRKFLQITFVLQINSQITMWILVWKVMRPLSSKIGDDWPINFFVAKVALLLDDGHLYWQRKCSRHGIATCQAVVPETQWPWSIILRSALLECEKKGNSLFLAQR